MGLFGLLSQIVDGATSHVFEPMAFLRRPARFLHYLAACGGSTTTGPNFSYEMLADTAEGGRAADLDLHSWRTAFNGGEPVRAGTVRRFQEVFAAAGVEPTTMYPVYGMAEATLAVSFPRRQKEMAVVYGRNYYPDDAEEAAKNVDGVYRGRCVSFAGISENGAEHLAIAVESAVPAPRRAALANEVRARVTAALGLSAVRVYVVEPRWLTRTTSGKWQRLLARQRLAQRCQDGGEP